MLAFVPLALVAPFFYGLEGNVVAKWGTAGLDPAEVLLARRSLARVLCCRLPFFRGSSSTRDRPGGRQSLR